MNPLNSLEHYLAQVCTKISNIRVHQSVYDELKDHILNIKDEYEEEGMAPEDALEIAFKKVGYANKVGQDLNKIHKDYDTLFVWIIMLCSLFSVIITCVCIVVFREWYAISYLLCAVMYFYLSFRFIYIFKLDEVLFVKAFRSKLKRENTYVENLTNKVFIIIGIVFFGIFSLSFSIEFIASLQQGKIDTLIISSVSMWINLFSYLLYSFRHSKIIVSTEGIFNYGLTFIPWTKVARYEWSSRGRKYILKLFTTKGKIRRLEFNINAIEQSILEGILLQTIGQKSKASI